MPIALNVTRPKLESTNTVGVNVVAGTVTESTPNIELVVRLQDLQPNTSPNFTCSYTLGSDQVTFTNTTGHPIDKLIRAGDILSGDEIAFPNNEYVTAISAVGTAITLTMSGDAQANGTDEVLTFAPAPIDSTLYIIQLTHSSNGSSLIVTPKIYAFDGTNVEDADANGVDDSVIGDASVTKTFGSHTINIDTYLQNARIARTNN